MTRQRLTCWRKCHDHTRLDDTGFDTSDRDRANTADLVDILERKTERLIGGTCWRVNAIDCLEEGLAGDLGLGLLFPSLVPGQLLETSIMLSPLKPEMGTNGTVLGL